MLPQKTTLKQQIKEVINNNPYHADNPADGEKAVDYFCDKMAELIIKTIKSSTVIINAGAINTTVTTSTGAGAGVNMSVVKGRIT